MANETLFAQITHETPSASRRETPLLPVCCICGFIRDEIKAAPDSERWVTQRTFRNTHDVDPAGCLLTHTYCPECFVQFMGTVSQHFREIGTTP